MISDAPALRLFFFADTHLGFDEPLRPRVERRRRGPDFFANFRRVLDDAVEHSADLVVHGGDLFFRSRVPEPIVDMVYGELLEFADKGIPLVIVPGNHERSRLPASIFLHHPNIHVFTEPSTFRLEIRGARVALAGFPSVRRNVRTDFNRLVAETGWESEPSDIRLLCLHQTFEGASVGPTSYTFRGGHDVICGSDVPGAFHAVLAGHIHRHQVLHPYGDRGPVTVIYPGSVERTSFAEAEETKGYCRVLFESDRSGAWALSGTEFVPLPARPMLTAQVPDGLAPAEVEGFLAGVAREGPPDAIVRFTYGKGVSPSTRDAFSARRLTAILPSTMSVQFASGFFGRRRERASDRLASEIRETVPESPGVYAFTDGDGRLLYIGKSVNLRRRMAGYFGVDPLRSRSRDRRPQGLHPERRHQQSRSPRPESRSTTREPRLGSLIASIRGFAWWQTRSELLALLLEDAMIKELLPPNNTRQREFSENVYLELTDGEFPSCLVVKHVADFGDREVFGPFKDRYFAERLRDAARESFGVRACRESEPVAKCLEHDIGRCSGPCRGALSQTEYRVIVGQTRDFLRGNVTAAVDRLTVARNAASADLRYEEAARLHDVIEMCCRFGEHQEFARGFEAGRHDVRADDVDHCFDGGALVEPRSIVVASGRSLDRAMGRGNGAFDSEAARLKAVAALRRPPSEDRRFLTDRARIVSNWVRRRGATSLKRAG